MRRLTFSVVAIMAMSTFTMAGGDMPPVPAEDSGFYVGSAYSYMNFNAKDGHHEFDVTANAYTVLAGYRFNKYVAIEGRYSQTIGDLDIDIDGAPPVGNTYDGADMSNIALYLKAMYPVGGATLYGLLGYGQFTFENNREYTENNFQWGAGVSYAVKERIALFVEYTRFYDDKDFGQGTGNPDTDVIVDAISFGVTYQF